MFFSEHSDILLKTRYYFSPVIRFFINHISLNKMNLTFISIKNINILEAMMYFRDAKI